MVIFHSFLYVYQRVVILTKHHSNEIAVRPWKSPPRRTPWESEETSSTSWKTIPSLEDRKVGWKHMIWYIVCTVYYTYITYIYILCNIMNNNNNSIIYMSMCSLIKCVCVCRLFSGNGWLSHQGLWWKTAPRECGDCLFSSGKIEGFP